jgi:hypothetical protein
MVEIDRSGRSAACLVRSPGKVSPRLCRTMLAAGCANLRTTALMAWHRPIASSVFKPRQVTLSNCTSAGEGRVCATSAPVRPIGTRFPTAIFAQKGKLARQPHGESDGYRRPSALNHRLPEVTLWGRLRPAPEEKLRDLHKDDHQRVQRQRFDQHQAESRIWFGI